MVICDSRKMKYRLNHEEKSHVMLILGLVILHYRHNCLDGDDVSNWHVGMINAAEEDVRGEIIGKCWPSNSFIFDNNSIGNWNVYSEKIAVEVLNLAIEKGFILDQTFDNNSYANVSSHIYIYRK